MYMYQGQQGAQILTSMHSLGFWNVRGLNDLNKQRVVRSFLHNNGVGLFGLLETKLKPSMLLNRNTSICDGWSVSTNCSWHKGSRIWVLWKPDLFYIQFVSYSAQHIHMMVHSRVDNKDFQLTMIYAFNGLYERNELWNTLKGISTNCCMPWLWLGDFNTVLSPIERLGGNATDAEMEVYSRLDRAMGNQEWLDGYANSLAHFHPEGLFDHCPCTIVDRNAAIGGKRTFKYFNMWGLAPSFKESVAMAWATVYRGTKMFSLVKKLKALKPILKSINRECFSDVENNTSIELVSARDSFLLQKAKVQWSLEGDLNTSYFHHVIKKRMMLNKVFQIEDQAGKLCTDGDTIQSRAFLEYYQGLLGSSTSTTEVNVNVVEGPTSVKYFRPISCCNVLYKAISKILCNRLALVLPDIISKNQGAFVKGRSILENILICQDLVRLYHRGNASPRCMFKLDLQKAYDSIEWAFVDQMLGALMFPEKFRQMVMTCVTTSSFTLNLNGAQFGYFKGRRGLRQGDPISPLLFCMCMEYLSRVMEFATRKWYFRYHPLCKSLKLTHLLFADDLLMFSKGDVQSIMLILRVMATFSAASGLIVNASKSEVVFCGVTDSLKNDIIQISGYQEGKLPFKYLGIPIQPGRLNRVDCNVLIEKIVSKVRGIGARKLSYAGRLVLINSIFNTLHNYWASIFLIPKGVIKRIEAICRNFLWCGESEYNRTPLVSWHDICFSKKEGGLGIQNTGVWNVASVGKLVHWLFTKADRLWVLWIDHVYLKGNTWVASPGGYTVSSGYHWMQGSHPPVLWYKDVWDTWLLLKYSFIAWLIQRKALNTRVKLHRLGLCLSDHCVLCEVGKETHDHLFTECDYSARVIAVVEERLHLCFTGSNQFYSKLRKKTCRMARMVTCYMIWNERNVCRLTLQLSRPEILVSIISQHVHNRLVFKMATVVTANDCDWLSSLHIRCSFCT
ncbi:uncharacterized protein LOC141618445 [Silene latifolia]|uniref:uncharacterized protein LOC141618445 n=1 Tax=Silene latifolia TaxID=37657 RepID=UPI003D77B1EF